MTPAIKDSAAGANRGEYRTEPVMEVSGQEAPGGSSMHESRELKWCRDTLNDLKMQAETPRVKKILGDALDLAAFHYANCED